MGDRRTAPRAPSPPVNTPARPPTAGPEALRPEPTGRVAPQAAELPSFFWGALGCVTVLGAGFTILFLVLRPGAGAPAVVTAPPAPPTAAAVPAPAGAARPSPDIEPMAPPPSPPPSSAPAAAPLAPVVHPKPAPHPIKVARAPSAATAGKADKNAEPKAADDSAGDSDAPTPPKKAAVEKTAESGAAQDEQPAARRRERASDDPDDD